MISALTADSVACGAVAEPALTARKAAMSDIAPLLGLINGYAAKGAMLARTEFEISENIRDFTVLFGGDDLVACGALHFYSPTAGEIRSLAVAENWKSHGIGRRLVEALLNEADCYSLQMVFAFTYIPDFFRKLGFEEVDRGVLPLKAWKDCLRCPKFQCCDEIAMVRAMPPCEGGFLPRTWGDPDTGGAANAIIRLPTVRI
jgi:amino-acid N-acetyltransferase